MASNLSIIIPTYNEESGIQKTLKGLISHPRLADAEIIIVDDGSTDQTGQVARKLEGVKVISHRINQGYGAALVSGMRQSSGEYIIWYDGDGQHNPSDLVKIYDRLVDDQLDYCIGVRDRSSHRVASRQVGKFILRIFVLFAAGERVSDFNSGLRGFKRKVIMQYLHLLPKGFSASTTTTLILKEQRYVGGEVPITVEKRLGKSSVNQFKDGFKTMMGVIRLMLLFKPMWFFGTTGLVFIIAGLVYGLIETFQYGLGFPVFGAVVIILGVQAFFFGLLNDQISQMRREGFKDLE
jgi:glycosyltransferase involved in cell wall biosynthesis